jgi:hypothetical protein
MCIIGYFCLCKNTVIYFDWKTVIYIYVCRKCRTQFMLPMENSVTFTGACGNEIIPSINRSFVYKTKKGGHVRILYKYDIQHTWFKYYVSLFSLICFFLWGLLRRGKSIGYFILLQYKRTTKN